MRARLLADFGRGAGLASPALILVWLALGAGLIWMQWNMGLAGIEAYSGTVKAVSADPKFGMHVTIDSSSVDFFFDSIGFEQFPDLRVGDHVAMLTHPFPQGYAVAVQSQRGTWIDSIFGGEITPFTPTTWPLHEALRWSLLTLGILIATFGLASLIRWVPSSQRPVASIGGTPAPDLLYASDAPSDVAPLEPAKSLDATGSTVVAASPATSRPASRPAPVSVWVGGATVIALPILELLGVISALGSCSAAGFVDSVLIATTIALAAGGISTLILASRSTSGSPQRALARRLGIVAIVMAVASVPLNLFLVLLSGFCAVG